MALSATSHRINPDAAGNSFLVYQDSSARNAQAVALVGEDGAHVGYEDHELFVSSLDWTHKEIHEGDAYVASQNVSLSSATRKYLITTPNTTKWAHLTFRVRSSVEANVVLYENPTDVSGGTTVNLYNRNRNSGNTAGITITYAPTEGGSFAAGTEIFREDFGSGNTGSDSQSREEFVLKQNEQYLLYVTTEAASGDVSVVFDWYEHTNH